MLFVIHAKDKPGALATRLANYDAHKAFLSDTSPHGVRSSSKARGCRGPESMLSKPPNQRTSRCSSNFSPPIRDSTHSHPGPAVTTYCQSSLRRIRPSHRSAVHRQTGFRFPRGCLTHRDVAVLFPRLPSAIRSPRPLRERCETTRTLTQSYGPVASANHRVQRRNNLRHHRS